MTEPRDEALWALYEIDMRRLEGPTGTFRSPKAARLVSGTLQHRAEIDDVITAASAHWRIERMPFVDRAILRLACYELLHELETPAAVVISEAVRMAGTYSTERSGGFVNGVLATVAARRAAPSQ